MFSMSPIGIPNIFFVVALCFFALWKTTWIRVLLAVCIIVWGVFAIPYDVKIGVPLVAMGAVLTTVGIANIVQAR